VTWLITGGAGYIGAHVVVAMQDAGLPVVVLDDLSSGHREFVPPDVPFVEGSIVDAGAVGRALDGSRVSGVVHLAGFKYAGVSVQQPLHTYRQNVVGMQVLLEEMAARDVARLVFSSSAAVYGTTDVDLVEESTPTAPESPYGESKLVAEWMIRALARARPLQQTSLRYFNVVGSGRPELYDTSPHNLFPLVLKALTSGRTPSVNGTDYPTPDGSCVRDYVHVADLALAHVAAARRMEQGESVEPVYNLGSGDGLSVLQVMDAVRRVTGIDFEPERRDRRPGDPARIVASGRLAARDLQWQMRYDVDQMVASAWDAWRAATSAAGGGAA
jgi:UDP-glucose 4-epimerase